MRASMYDVLVCVFKIFSETTGPTVAKFMLTHNGIGEENVFKLFRSFVVLHLNIVSLWGWGFSQGFYHKCGPAVQVF